MGPVVVLLHGLARGAPSMAGMASVLTRAGFETWAGEYPSTSISIPEAADEVARQLRAQLPDRELHAVTHSMGGVVVRHLGDRGLRWKRIVMLAPPNRGSRMAWTLRNVGAFQGAFGPAGQGLGQAVEVEKLWPYPPAPFAVIAGRRRFAWSSPTSWLSRFIFPEDAEHDGTVLVEETRLEGASAFATVDASHSSVLDDRYAQELTISFLRNGVFQLR